MMSPLLSGSNPPSPGTPSSSTSSLADMAAAAGIDLSGLGMGGGSTDYAAAQSRNYSDPFIYQGTKRITRSTNANVAEHVLASGGSTQGSLLSDLQRKFMQSDEANRRHWAYLMALTGYAGGEIASDPRKAAEFAKNAALIDVLDMHKKFLQDAADQFNIYRRKITPTQLMKEMLAFRLGDKFNGNLKTLTPDNVGALGGQSLAGTHTTTQKSIDFLNPEDAKGLVRATLQQQLGRDPTQAEYEDFLSVIHAAERSHPTTTRTTSTTNDQGDIVSQSSVTHGGLTSEGYNQLAYEKARQMPSWAVWQAVGTYAPALFAALDSPISGV